jgi:hypothetical protein
LLQPYRPRYWEMHGKVHKSAVFACCNGTALQLYPVSPTIFCSAMSPLPVARCPLPKKLSNSCPKLPIPANLPANGGVRKQIHTHWPRPKVASCFYLVEKISKDIVPKIVQCPADFSANGGVRFTAAVKQIHIGPAQKWPLAFGRDSCSKLSHCFVELFRLIAAS